MLSVRLVVKHNGFRRLIRLLTSDAVNQNAHGYLRTLMVSKIQCRWVAAETMSVTLKSTMSDFSVEKTLSVALWCLLWMKLTVVPQYRLQSVSPR